MLDKIWKQYVLINYCGQRASGSFFNKRSVVNIFIFEFSFITSAMPIGVFLAFGYRNPWIGAIIASTYVLILWEKLEFRIRKNIDFENCELYLISLTKGMRIFFFILMILLFMSTFSFFIYSMKLISYMF